MSPYKDALTSSPDLTISSGDALGFMNIITRSQRGGGHVAITQTMGNMLMLHLFYVIHA